jgi:hypothetical protein
MNKKIVIPAALLLIFPICKAQDMSAKEIVREADQLLMGNSNYAEVSMQGLLFFYSYCCFFISVNIK